MSFRILGLPAEDFAPLFTLRDDELAQRHARRVRTHAHSRYPCRVSLTDAAPDSEVLLVNYEHHPVDSPYRASYAIYVRPGEQTYDAVDTVPEQLRTRYLAVRAYDADAMLVGCALAHGEGLEAAITEAFSAPEAAYLHLHFAKPGCYAARVERA